MLFLTWIILKVVLKEIKWQKQLLWSILSNSCSRHVIRFHNKILWRSRFINRLKGCGAGHSLKSCWNWNLSEAFNKNFNNNKEWLYYRKAFHRYSIFFKITLNCCYWMRWELKKENFQYKNYIITTLWSTEVDVSLWDRNYGFREKAIWWFSVDECK